MYQKFINTFVFTGFLDAGKTSFLQGSFENPNFCTGEATLLLICEEGECEYDAGNFAAGGVVIRHVESQEQLTRTLLESLTEEFGISRAVIEYNGMWLLETLYRALPETWRVRQEMLFIDSKTFISYNNNMRQLMYDKLSSCMVAVFNDPDEKLDRAFVHKIVRGASRRADIVYQFPDGHMEYDAEKEELPFDIHAPVIRTQDCDFALWARDITDTPEKYNGKKICLTCCAVRTEDMPAEEMGIGRYVMVCCENDIEFVGFMCSKPAELAIENDQWIQMLGTVELKFHPSYNKIGPVFSLISAEACSPPSQAVATFY